MILTEEQIKLCKPFETILSKYSLTSKNRLPHISYRQRMELADVYNTIVPGGKACGRGCNATKFILRLGTWYQETIAYNEGKDLEIVKEIKQVQVNGRKLRTKEECMQSTVEGIEAVKPANTASVCDGDNTVSNLVHHGDTLVSEPIGVRNDNDVKAGELKDSKPKTRKPRTTKAKK